MNDVCDFLSESQTLLKKNKKTITQIYNEFRNYLPCLLNMLPIEMKIEIVTIAGNVETKLWLHPHKLGYLLPAKALTCP